jgi:flavin-dependent dehydrogenase
MTVDNIKNHYQVVIVGAGPAGAAAAIYCKKYNLEVLLIDKKNSPAIKPVVMAFLLKHSVYWKN